MPDTENSHAHWVEIATFDTGLEADMARALLEGEQIPAMLESRAPGIFGAAFQGSITGGVSLMVPSPEVERAKLLLDVE